MKKFIALQTPSIKSILPGATPDTIQNVIKDLFVNDIERLKTLFKINSINVYSNKAIINLVMKIASPIIHDIKIILQQHITEELLKENTKTEEFTINIEELWKKVNKTLARFQSGFADEEYKFKDNILMK